MHITGSNETKRRPSPERPAVRTADCGLRAGRWLSIVVAVPDDVHKLHDGVGV